MEKELHFFAKLSPRGANEFLRRFLEVESLHIKETIKQCAADGVKMDYSLKSLSPFFRWVATKVRTISIEPDPAALEWLRNHEVYAKNLFDFDEPSRIFVTRAGYYLGESFVRSFSNLGWGTGDIKTYEKNMPVVAGFRLKTEMPAIRVADNLLATIITERNKSQVIKECIEAWRRDV